MPCPDVPDVPWTPPGMGSSLAVCTFSAMSRGCSLTENKLAQTVEGKNVFRRHAGELLASLTPVFHKMSRSSKQCMVQNGSPQAHGVVFVLSLKLRVGHECFSLELLGLVLAGSRELFFYTCIKNCDFDKPCCVMQSPP